MPRLVGRLKQQEPGVLAGEREVRADATGWGKEQRPVRSSGFEGLDVARNKRVEP